MRTALPLMGERRDELGSDFDPTRHRHKRRIASIIVTANAAPKIIAKIRHSATTQDHNQAANTASATSSRKRGFISCSFLCTTVHRWYHPPGGRQMGTMP